MPLLSLSELQRKKIIVGLLAGSCVVALIILLFHPSGRSNNLPGLALADSLIHQELTLFNVPDERIRTIEYPVNEDFTRKRFVVELPAQVSKTHLHAELHKQLQNWRVETIGYVDVPEDEMTVHMIYRDKIIRSLDLHTDPDFERIPHPAGLWVYFNRRPSVSHIEQIRRLDIPVGIVLRSDSRRTLTRWSGELPDDMSRVWIWYDDERTSYGDTALDDPDLLESLEAVSRVQENIRLLAFNEDHPGSEIEQNEQLESLEVEVDNGSGMMIISSDNRFEFDQQMLAYSRLARQAAGPRLMVHATDNTLEWLEEWIPRIQRGGVVFTAL